MTETELFRACAEFDAGLAAARSADAAYRVLQDLAQRVVGVRLFTVMTVDMVQGVARRSYSSDPANYPVSGTKPIHYDDWFATVSEKRIPFIANTLSDIAKVFPDYQLIGSLGCGSVINLPIFIDDHLVCTVNMLHEEHFYTDARVSTARSVLERPAAAAYRAATDLA